MEMTLESLASAVTTGATIFGLIAAFGRMWLKNALAENNAAMMALINGKYISKDLADARYQDLDRRLSNVERR